MEYTFPKDFLYKAWLFQSDFRIVWSEAGEKILWLFWVTELWVMAWKELAWILFDRKKAMVT